MSEDPNVQQDDSVIDDSNLDDFSKSFFSPEDLTPEPANSEEDVDEAEEDTPDNAHDTSEETPDEDDEDEDDTLAEDEDDEPDEDVKPKKKNRFQERIDKAVGKQRVAERELTSIQERLDAALAELQNLKQDTKPKPTPEAGTNTSEPTPSDLDEDGNDKYPLGEFDPNYFKDLTKYYLAKDKEEAQTQAEQAREKEQYDQVRNELQNNWNEKLEPALERYPDFHEKGEQLLGTFENIDASYGEYLATTLMSMDHGTDVLYYLANNPDEAQKIVDSGPQKATIALGRIESKFFDEVKPTKSVKSSKAPPPPPRNKGSAAAVAETPDSTDDLDAFAKKFFKK